ncbi:hypothetical protein E3W21_00090 [Pseudomonas sp. F01002]|nr:hypothetical protein E3W21_00090 [Pseudomonas sp. F01002]
MADGGGPPEQCRSEGMPSLSEAPNGGARALGYLGLGGIPYFQVTRCKSETASRRYQNNGYAPNPKSKKKAATTRRCGDPRVTDKSQPTGMGRRQINEPQQPCSNHSQPIRYKRKHPQ